MAAVVEVFVCSTGAATLDSSSSSSAATGGGGQIFAQTTNPALSTGDGVAMAWRAGALLRFGFISFTPQR